MASNQQTFLQQLQVFSQIHQEMCDFKHFERANQAQIFLGSREEASETEEAEPKCVEDSMVHAEAMFSFLGMKGGAAEEMEEYYPDAQKRELANIGDRMAQQLFLCQLQALPKIGDPLVEDTPAQEKVGQEVEVSLEEFETDEEEEMEGGESCEFVPRTTPRKFEMHLPAGMSALLGIGPERAVGERSAEKTDAETKGIETPVGKREFGVKKNMRATVSNAKKQVKGKGRKRGRKPNVEKKYVAVEAEKEAEETETDIIKLLSKAGRYHEDQNKVWEQIKTEVSEDEDEDEQKEEEEPSETDEPQTTVFTRSGRKVVLSEALVKSGVLFNKKKKPKTKSPPAKPVAVFEKIRCRICCKMITVRKESEIEKQPTRKQTFRCSACSSAVISKTSFKRLKIKTTGEKLFPCASCGSLHSTSQSLQIHMKTHSEETPLRCNLCQKSFRNGPSLKVHVKAHTRKKPIVCVVCQKIFASENAMLAHYEVHSLGPQSAKGARTGPAKKNTPAAEPVPKTAICHICKRGFENEDELKEHAQVHLQGKKVKMNHSKGKRRYSKVRIVLKCTLCNKTFDARRHLKRHLKDQHGGPKSYTCRRKRAKVE